MSNRKCACCKNEAVDRSHCGWSTYETWLAALWIDNDEILYRQWRAVAAECRAETANSADAVQALAETLGVAFEDVVSARLGDKADLVSDLVQAGLAEINWYELAGHLLEP